jgi:hypothetical protein
MFDSLRQKLPEESIFRKPLVFEITLVLIIKILLLILLWHLAFKPIKPSVTPDIHQQMGLPQDTKDTHHE